jgi:hypothetical protein
MLKQPILSGTIGSLAYVLIDCDLVYESMHARQGRGIADFIVLILPNNLVCKTSVSLEYLCTNSQAKYKHLQFGLQNLVDIGVKDIVAENSLVVV